MHRAVRQDERDRQRRDLPAGSTHFALGFEILHLADRTIEPDGVERGHRRQQRRLAFAHQFADGNLLGPDQTGDRRAHVAVSEVNGGGLHARLRGKHARIAHVHGGDGIVQILLWHGPLLGERLEPGDVLLVFVQLSLGLGQQAVGGGKAFLERFLVEQE
jgi:hypothetical protein